MAADWQLTSLHARMPVPLEEDAWSLWLDQKERSSLALAELTATGRRAQLAMFAVSTLVNYVRTRGWHRSSVFPSSPGEPVPLPLTA